MIAGMLRPPAAHAILFGGLGALGAALACGCTQIDTTYGQTPPSAAALAGVTEGLTTEAEVIARLGPPEEYLQPLALPLGRADEGARRRVDDERDLFGRRVLTWACEVRTDREFAVLPRLPLLGDLLTVFRVTHTTHTSERLVILVDERGLVEAVGREAPVVPP
jgi:hypothetical protein